MGDYLLVLGTRHRRQTELRVRLGRRRLVAGAFGVGEQPSQLLFGRSGCQTELKVELAQATGALLSGVCGSRNRAVDAIRAATEATHPLTVTVLDSAGDQHLLEQPPQLRPLPVAQGCDERVESFGFPGEKLLRQPPPGRRQVEREAPAVAAPPFDPALGFEPIDESNGAGLRQRQWATQLFEAEPGPGAHEQQGGRGSTAETQYVSGRHVDGIGNQPASRRDNVRCRRMHAQGMLRVLAAPTSELGGGPDLDQLATVVGRARARVLSVLRTPRTTEEVAQELGSATSTISEHLNALAKAGLATRNREQRVVYYELSERGRRLVDLLSG